MDKLALIQAIIGAPESPQAAASMNNGVWKIGRKYLVRTVTNYIVGQLIDVTEHELLFGTAAWVASTGRFSECCKTGSLDEVEPYTNDVIVGRGSITDATEWPFELPRSAK